MRGMYTVLHTVSRRIVQRVVDTYMVIQSSYHWCKSGSALTSSTRSSATSGRFSFVSSCALSSRVSCTLTLRSICVYGVVQRVVILYYMISHSSYH
jgi:hypothetical protein